MHPPRSVMVRTRTSTIEAAMAIFSSGEAFPSAAISLRIRSRPPGRCLTFHR